jgi:hypothetical protein
MMTWLLAAGSPGTGRTQVASRSERPSTARQAPRTRPGPEPPNGHLPRLRNKPGLAGMKCAGMTTLLMYCSRVYFYRLAHVSFPLSGLEKGCAVSDISQTSPILKNTWVGFSNSPGALLYLHQARGSTHKRMDRLAFESQRWCLWPGLLNSLVEPRCKCQGLLPSEGPCAQPGEAGLTDRSGWTYGSPEDGEHSPRGATLSSNFGDFLE